MKMAILLYASCAAFLVTGCTELPDRRATKTEIERLLKIQEDAYGDHSPEARKRTMETCADSLIYIGGDSGGLATSSAFWVNDLADGYIEKPHDRHFQIYDNTVVVTSLHQGYKLLSDDTLRLNSRSTKVFTKHQGAWKMVYVTYAALPMMYFKTPSVDPNVLKNYEGKYQLDTATIETVTVRDGKLISNVGTDEAQLTPINDSTFMIPGFFGKSVFVKNKKGIVIHYYFEWNDGQRIVFNKVK